MKKQWLFALGGLTYFIVSPYLKKLPVVGGLLGFIEFLAILLIIGTILYYLGLHLYLWFKVRKRSD